MFLRNEKGNERWDETREGRRGLVLLFVLLCLLFVCLSRFCEEEEKEKVCVNFAASCCDDREQDDDDVDDDEKEAKGRKGKRGMAKDGRTSETDVTKEGDAATWTVPMHFG